MNSISKGFYFFLPLFFSFELVAFEGHTFPILEEDPAKAIMGVLDAEKGELTPDKETFLNQVRSLPAAQGITEATEYHSFLFDPTYSVPEDIVDHKGRKIAEEGQKVNPLEKIQVLQDLILFDGTNPDHIQWAKKQPAAKWILIKGSPIEVEEKTGYPTFFDQMGELCQRFKIKKVPCKLSRQDDKILVEEIPVGG